MSAMGQSERALQVQFRADRRSIVSTLNEITNQIKAGDEQELPQLEANLSEVSSKLKQFYDVSVELTEFIDSQGKTDAAIQAEEDKLLGEYDRLYTLYRNNKAQYVKLYTKFKEQREKKESTSIAGRSSVGGLNVSTIVDSNTVKLPRVQLKKFSGERKEFHDWAGMFENAIINDDRYDNLQKLYFLKSLVEGEAAKLISNVPYEASALDPAWKSIKDFYGNKRSLIAQYYADIFDLPVIKSADDIRNTICTVNSAMRGLEVYSINAKEQSSMITFAVVRKFSPNIRKEWEKYNNDTNTYPEFSSLEAFMRMISFAFEGAKSSSIENESPKVVKGAKSADKKATLTTTSSVPMKRHFYKCPLCAGEHLLAFCEKYLALPIADRYASAVKLQLCVNCLKPNHKATECRNLGCKKCNKRHNTTMHREEVKPTPQQKEADQSTKTEEAAVVIAAAKHSQPTYLPTAIANVVLGWRKVAVRILLDSCAQTSLVTEAFVKRHRIPTYRHSTTITGATPGDFVSSHAVTLRLASRTEKFELEIQAIVHPKIPYDVDAKVVEQLRKQLSQFQLSENASLDHDSVDVLIGVDYLSKVITTEKKIIDNLILEASHFGWVAAGVVTSRSDTHRVACNLIVEIQDDLKKFWEIEEVDPIHSASSEHECVEEHFKATFKRLETGRFSVALPFRKSKAEVADTYHMALAALKRSERHLDNPTRQLYREFMADYLNLSHMELVSEQEARPSVAYYLPHHAVMRPDSITTKIRVVFNGSAKNSSGVSLNSALMVGPTIQSDLFINLIKFRRFAIAFAADISKMYRQIEVHNEDRDMQRILWRDLPNEAIKTYRLKTITYGTSAAPFLATRCLQQLSLEIKEEHPDAAQAIAEEFYMDDWLSGGHTIQHALDKQKIVHDTLSKASLPLVKYSSNSSQLLNSLDNKLVDSLKTVEFNNSEEISVLGLKWMPEDDLLAVKLNSEKLTCTKFTRRNVLSLISKIFDPLGLLAPVTVTGKIIVQDIWKEEIGWDTQVSQNLHSKIQGYLKSLANLNEVAFKRLYVENYMRCKRQLLGFCDASEQAYAAVVYLRCEDINGAKCTLICSKNRVAPIKNLTIPRLELLGTVLLSKLCDRVRKILDIAVTDTYCFCDSTIALSWLRGPAENYHVFIKNRAQFVNSILPISQWHYVKGDQNVADLCTRGITASKFKDIQSTWENGPEWILTHFEEYVEATIPCLEEKLTPEIRKRVVFVMESSENTMKYLIRFSSFTRLEHVTAYIFRWRNRPKTGFKSLTLPEVSKASTRILKLFQEIYYQVEYEALQKGASLPVRSTLKSLNVFLDNESLIRVGGRLTNSSLSYDRKYPIVLPGKHTFTAILVRDFHERYLHASYRLLDSLVRSRYWLIGGVHKLLKGTIQRCIRCTRLRATLSKQLMADLPKTRVEVSRPFRNTGVDFAGPVLTKCTRHRSTKVNKTYLAFFVCFSTKAVHIEVVGDLSTESFFAAFDRFISRRGLPLTMVSDNATNFVGFANLLSNNRLNEYATKQKFVWKFIPARSPHMGGIWEAAVKSGKVVLLKSIGKQVLNLEELSTVTTKIEAILNSRPLCQSLNNTDYLTPGHFLIGSSLLELPNTEKCAMPLSRRYNLLRQIINSFWSTWKRAYLNQLQVRNKWQTRQTNIEVGNVVALRDSNLPVLQWPLAKVVKVFKDHDNAVRSVEVLCKDRVVTRAVQQLVLLPVDSSSSESKDKL